MRYTKKFIIQLLKYYRINCGMEPAEAFENFEVNYSEPFVHFPYKEVMQLVCEFYNVNADEFQSTFKYGKLPMARKMVVRLLDHYGLKNKHIAAHTGFLPAYISFAMREEFDRIYSADLAVLAKVIEERSIIKPEHLF